MKNRTIFSVVRCFLVTWAFLRIFQIETTNLLSIVFAVLTWLLIRQTRRYEKKAEWIPVLVLSGVCSLFYVCGAYRKILSGLDNRFFQIGILLITVAGLWILLYYLMTFLLQGMQRFSAAVFTDEKASGNQNLFVYLFTTIACLICWLPYFLKNYPGIMNIDSINQYAQVIGAWQQSNHHPWWHTQVIRLFYTIGLKLTGSQVHGIAFYTVFQMLLMAVIAGYAVETLHSVTGYSKRVSCLAGLVIAILPYNGIYAVTVWKDAAFAAGVLLYCVCIYRLCYKKMNLVLFGISCLMISLFRNNGWYVFLCMIPVLLIGFRRYWKRLAVTLLLCLGIILIMKGPLMERFGVVETETTESLSIPLQQIARTVVENGNLTEQQTAYIDRIVGIEHIKENYNPVVSDPIKNKARDLDELPQDMREFFKNYIAIGLHNPGSYLRGYIDQTYGFWFPESTLLVGGDEYIIPNEFGVASSPVLKGTWVVKLHEINLKLKSLVPFYGLLWCMGAVFWAMLFLCVYLLIERRYQEILVLLPGILITLSLMVATPLAEDFRYAYGYIFCLPFYVMICLRQKESLN